jgi:hypothetical protein
MKLTPKDLAPKSTDERTGRGTIWEMRRSLRYGETLTGFADGDFDCRTSMRMYLVLR